MTTAPTPPPSWPYPRTTAYLLLVATLLVLMNYL